MTDFPRIRDAAQRIACAAEVAWHVEDTQPHLSESKRGEIAAGLLTIAGELGFQLIPRREGIALLPVHLPRAG